MIPFQFIFFSDAPYFQLFRIKFFLCANTLLSLLHHLLMFPLKCRCLFPLSCYIKACASIQCCWLSFKETLTETTRAVQMYSPLIRYEAFRPFLPIIKPSFAGKLGFSSAVLTVVDTFSLKVGLQNKQTK